MALNGTEVLILAHLVSKLPRPVRALSLGYPTLLVGRDFLPEHLPRIKDVPIRADSVEVGRGHGFENDGLFESRAFFSALGVDLDVSNIADLGNDEIILDLNVPVPFSERYDLIIDPGTLEHCFDIAMALRNITAMLKVGGWVYHQAAISFPGHGFFGISPSLFVDFYSSNGFEVAEPYCFGNGSLGARADSAGLYLPWHKIDFASEYPRAPGWIVGAYLAAKRQIVAPKTPIQFRYRNAPRPVLLPTIADALAKLPNAIGNEMEALGYQLVP